MFSDYLCLEHGGFAQRKAHKLWREMSKEEPVVPGTTEEALERVSELRMPTHLRVWTNKQYPEIMERCYDGTAFGTEQEACEPPEIEGAFQSSPIASLASDYTGIDDDIPF